MITTESIEKSVREAFAEQNGSFRPCAYYDDALDCIRVITRDCSVIETRVNGLITICDALHPNGPRCVGFTIKGARHFCRRHSLPVSTPIKITALLDAILEQCPETIVEAFVNHTARPLIRDYGVDTLELALEPMTA